MRKATVLTPHRCQGTPNPPTLKKADNVRGRPSHAGCRNSNIIVVVPVNNIPPKLKKTVAPGVCQNGLQSPLHQRRADRAVTSM